jgi:hypothetical protein
MRVSTLRNATPVLRLIGKRVSIHNGDSPKEIGQHSRGKQPAHAGPKDDRVRIWLGHGDAPHSPSKYGGEPAPSKLSVGHAEYRIFAQSVSPSRAGLACLRIEVRGPQPGK